MDELTTKLAEVTVSNGTNTDTDSKSQSQSRKRRVSRKPTNSGTASTKTGAVGARLEGSFSELTAKYVQNGTQTDNSFHPIRAVPTEMEKIQAKLYETEASLEAVRLEYALQKEHLCSAQADLKNAKKSAEDLMERERRRKTVHDLQFRRYTIDSEPRYAKFDLVQTFSTKPMYGPDRAVIAFVEIGGKRYLAQNGLHRATPDGLISGKDYSKEASKLFRALGAVNEETIFQHAEPQLMALYVEQFCNSRRLDFQQFMNKHDASRRTELLEVEIFISEAACWYCKTLSEKVNETAEEYGFRFLLEDISINKESCV
ncbi:hypothetical protein GT037_001989 [Alternaria burnsii]|uniref:Uncharacterized protein n=1 Tax=Alternaria burnsii TaxID=1187904 RepID=A0A8H7BF94_9PLEO|nr:uncharacterized protein GT037_001989 [Alternaria burnsii]KAF7680338.1 hypothetical protein GT037_001989 [Alternaria burnsii]